MRVILHPRVHADIDAIMGYYEHAASRELAHDFYTELRHSISDAAERPESFAARVRDLRRVNLRRFPYHFLFRISNEAVRILVVRHHRRDPLFGVHRR